MGGGNVAAVVAVLIRSGKADIPVDTLNDFLTPDERPSCTLDEFLASADVIEDRTGVSPADVGQPLVDPLGGISLASTTRVRESAQKLDSPLVCSTPLPRSERTSSSL